VIAKHLVVSAVLAGFAIATPGPQLELPQHDRSLYPGVRRAHVLGFGESCGGVSPGC
jgi:threonine/homoserine/homoserine lactone efflux protein